MLYCLLTGRPPFQSADRLETMRQVCETEPVPPRLLNPQVPRDLETICLKCLEKQVDKRYDSAAEVVAELGRYERGEPVRSRPVSGAQRAWRWCKRNPVVAGLAMLAAMLLLALSVVSVLFALYVAEKERKARIKADVAEKIAAREKNLKEETEKKLAMADAGRQRVEEEKREITWKLERARKAEEKAEQLSKEKEEAVRERDAAKNKADAEANRAAAAQKERDQAREEKNTAVKTARAESAKLKDRFEAIERTIQQTKLWFVLKNATDATVRYQIRSLHWDGTWREGEEDEIGKKKSKAISAPAGSVRIELHYKSGVKDGKELRRFRVLNPQSFRDSAKPEVSDIDCTYTFEYSRDRNAVLLLRK
jgi:hypothetical protein